MIKRDKVNSNIKLNLINNEIIIIKKRNKKNKKN